MNFTVTAVAALVGAGFLWLVSLLALWFRVLEDKTLPFQALLVRLAQGVLNVSFLMIPLFVVFAAVELDELVRLVLATALALVFAPLQIALNRSLIKRQPQEQDDRQDTILTVGLYNFAEMISGVVDLDELVKSTMRYLQVTFHSQRGALILVMPSKSAGENEEGYMTLKAHPIGLGVIPKTEEEVMMSGALLRRLLIERRPLHQRDVESAFGQELTDSERAFFRKMDLRVYVPVIAQGNFIGILCAGEKNDPHMPYSEAETDSLFTIANQIGTVLRNARLVDDLRRREKEVSETNVALQEAKRQLEQLDSVKTDFITIASHELRTPLAQIRGYTDIITALNEQGMLDPEQLTGMTENLRKATDRMEELIRNMLDVSQLDVNAMDLRFGPITLSNVVKLAIEPYTEAIRSRKLSISARGLRELPEIQGDMKRMVQAFQNVIVNAIKFTPDGGRIDIEGGVHSHPETQADEIIVSIKDTGIGVDSKNKDIIFEKFVRTQDPSLHSTGKTKFMGAGPGLGLTIARGVIDGHGGRIWVESGGYNLETFPGSTFFIALPIEVSERASGVLRFDNSSMKMDRTELKRRMEAKQAEKS